MNRTDYDFFRENGYLVLGKVLSDGEVARYEGVFDRDRRECGHLWYYMGRETHQTGNIDVMVSSPEMDGIVRHPRILPVVQELMGDALSILEVSARHMDVHPGEPANPQQWHRDTKHLDGHPLRLDYLQSMVYLTDVSEETHFFAICPESCGDPVLDTEEQLQKAGGGKPLPGPAGTVILFNASALHAGTVVRTRFERKTLQTYYCHRERMIGSLDMVIPARLWRDHTDPGARDLYAPQMQAQVPGGHRELRAGRLELNLLPDPAAPAAAERCPWNEAEGTEEHVCHATGRQKCRYFQGLKRPDIVLCGYPQ